MAFTYKNPLEQAINQLPTQYSDQITSQLTDILTTKVDFLNKHFSFCLNKEVERILIERGIELAPIQFNVHSHPACKTIENHLIFRVLPNLLKKISSVAFFSMRDEKVSKVIKLRNMMKYGEFKVIDSLNLNLDAKDRFRYQNAARLPVSIDQRLDVLELEIQKLGWTPKVCFVHDEFHYWEPLDTIKMFRRFPEIQTLLATIVAPPELLLGENVSKNPRIYDFTCGRYSFTFFPDGVSSEAYTQNIENSLWPLKHRAITDGHITLRVNVLDSIFAHHIISIDRGTAFQDTIFLDKPSCLLNHELLRINPKFEDSIIERETMMSILVYLSCLKSPNKESAMAKLRQLEKRSTFPDEAYIVATISSTFIDYSFSDRCDLGLMETLKGFLMDNFPGFLKNFFDKNRMWNHLFRDFMREISIKRFSCQRGIMSLFEDFEEIEPTPAIFDRVSAPYSYVLTRSRLPLPFALFFNSFLSDGQNKVPFQRTVVVRRRRVPIVRNSGITNSLGQFLLEGDSFLNHKLIPTLDQVSSNGLILSSEMVVDEKIVSSIRYSKRKNSCVFDSIASELKEKSEDIINELINKDITDDLFEAIENDEPISIEQITEIALSLDLCIIILMDGDIKKINISGSRRVSLELKNGHATPIYSKVVQQKIASSLGYQCSSSPSESIHESMLNKGIMNLSWTSSAKLLKSLCRGSTGIFKEIFPNKVDDLRKLSMVFDTLNDKSFEFAFKFSMNLGFAGSGKSKAVADYLNRNPYKSACIISPRRALAEDWSKKLKGTTHVVCTFEKALAMNLRGYNSIIIDEVSLLPPGFIDTIVALSMLHKGGCSFIGNIGVRKAEEVFKSDDIRIPNICCLGDPMQNFYYSDLDSSLLNRSHDLYRMLQNIEGPLKYLWYSYRLPSCFSNLIDVPCLGSKEAFDFKIFSETSAVKISEYDAILVASHEDKRMCTISLSPYTYGEVQGLTFEKKVLIGISRDTLNVSTNALIVSLTRSKAGFDFFMLTEMTIDSIKKVTAKKFLGYILEKRKVSFDRIRGIIPCKDIDLIKLNGNLEDKAANDVFILPEIQPDFPFGEEPEEMVISFQPEWMKTHMPIRSENPLLIEIFDRMRLKESREFWHSSLGASTQFPDDDKGLIENVMGFSFRFDAMFPRHNGSDSVTFLKAVEKRLRFSDPRSERRKMEESSKYSKELLDWFLKHLPNTFEVTTEDIEMGINSFNEKRAQKSEALWKAHAERSDVDWPLNHIFLFMKAQLCTKQEKMFTDAKAGQTLACFHHTILFRFGPMLRAIERAFIRACGDSYYIHSGKNFLALNDFVVNNANLFDGNSIESDYEAFDASQDSMILAFELELFKKLGVSKGFIEDYASLKLNLGCRLGSFAIMRFTGEFCTFLFNTFANMLFTFLKYRVNPKVDRILFAGDDMASLGRLKRHSGRQKTLIEKFTLKAKEEVKRLPLFCGWYLTPDGIFKSPKLLWSRICLMKQKGLINICLDNYFLEAVFAYNLGERLYQYIDEKDIEYHYCSVRFFAKSKDKLTGLAKKTAFGSEYLFGNKCQSSKSTILLSGLKTRTSRLMPSRLLKFMGMLISFLRKFYKASEGLKVTSRLEILKGIQSQWVHFQFLITSRWNSSIKWGKNILTYMLVQSLCASPPSFQILERNGVIYLSKIKVVTQLRMVTLQLMSSTSRMALLSLSSGLNIACQQLTHICLNVSKLLLKLRTLILKLGDRYSVLTSAVFIDCRIRLVFYVAQLLTRVGLNKRFGALSVSNSIMKGRRECWRIQRRSDSLILGLIFMIAKRNISESNLRSEENLTALIAGTMSRLRKRGLLGPSQKILMNYYERRRKEMSIQGAIRSTIRQMCDQHLWAIYIDQNHQVLDANTILTQIPQERREAFQQLRLHYMKHLFGNLATLGSSSKTVWPNVTINLPTLTVRVGENNIVKNLTLNLAIVIPALETWRKSSDSQIIKEATFRQFCEAYAPEAYLFLKENFNLGVSTNLYIKWPRALEAAPWVAFDFCSGLRMDELTPDERKVVDRLTKRLFRTEGQKGIFEAGQEVNVDLEG